MRILEVSNFFKPSWESGGPTRVVYEISKELVERGHNVTVYTTDGFKYRLDIKKNGPCNVDGIKTYYFTNFSSYLVRQKVFTTPLYSPIIVKKNIQNFDIIHLHGGNFLGYFVMRYAKKKKIPYIFQAHGALAHRMSAKRGKLGKIWDYFVDFKILQNASKVIAISVDEEKQYIAMGIKKEKIVIVPNGINLTEFQNLPKKGDFRKKWKINVNDKLILFFGRINSIKGIDLLIDAFTELNYEINNVKLIIAGPDDRYKQTIERKIKELGIQSKIIFTGSVNGTERLSMYSDADVYVLPSKYEAFGITILESCACGTPTIVSDRCSISSFSELKKLIVISSYNKDDLKSKIIDILTNKQGIKNLSKEERETILMNFSWNSIVDRIEKIYSELNEVPTKT